MMAGQPFGSVWQFVFAEASNASRSNGQPPRQCTSRCGQGSGPKWPKGRQGMKEAMMAG